MWCVSGNIGTLQWHFLKGIKVRYFYDFLTMNEYIGQWQINALQSWKISKRKIVLGYTNFFIFGRSNLQLTYPFTTLDLESFNLRSPRSILIKGISLQLTVCIVSPTQVTLWQIYNWRWFHDDWKTNNGRTVYAVVLIYGSDDQIMSYMWGNETPPIMGPQKLIYFNTP